MPGDLARGIEARQRTVRAQHFRPFAGGDATERVSDRADQRIGKEGRLLDRAGPIGFGRHEAGTRSKAVASRRIEAGGIAGGAIVGRDRLGKLRGIDFDRRGKSFERVGLMRRHLRAYCASKVGDVVEPAVEDRVNLAAGRVEMNVPRKALPGFVDEAPAFIEKTPAIAVDDDAIG